MTDIKDMVFGRMEMTQMRYGDTVIIENQLKDTRSPLEEKDKEDYSLLAHAAMGSESGTHDSNDVHPQFVANRGSGRNGAWNRAGYGDATFELQHRDEPLAAKEGQ